ncbi:MAG: hypothetical protein RML56_00385 [Burkholderiales bacterium]|nr:hypothetical protein [Burkholderiales bacterium]MDW8467671.1 hypothetical protein [Burkholderiales bacterium]
MPLAQSELAAAVAALERGDWQAAHRIVQQDEASPLACWAHGIVHLMEGDTANARYWYRAARRRFPEGVALAAEIAQLKEALNA